MKLSSASLASLLLASYNSNWTFAFQPNVVTTFKSLAKKSSLYSTTEEATVASKTLEKVASDPKDGPYADEA